LLRTVAPIVPDRQSQALLLVDIVYVEASSPTLDAEHSSRGSSRKDGDGAWIGMDSDVAPIFFIYWSLFQRIGLSSDRSRARTTSSAACHMSDNLITTRRLSQPASSDPIDRLRLRQHRRHTVSQLPTPPSHSAIVVSGLAQP
jgi:hypothetical protein